MPTRAFIENPMCEYVTTNVLIQALACQAHGAETKIGKRFYMPAFYATEDKCCGFFFGTHRDKTFEYGKMMKNMAPDILSTGVKLLAGAVLRIGNVSDGAAYELFRTRDKTVRGKTKGSHFYQGIANSYRKAEGLTYWMIINEIDKEQSPLASSTVLTSLTRSSSEFDVNMCGVFKILKDTAGTHRFYLHFFSTSYDRYVYEVNQVTDAGFNPLDIDAWTRAWQSSFREVLVLQASELPEEPTQPSPFDDMTVVMDNPMAALQA